jgi:hypothetical protein
MDGRALGALSVELSIARAMPAAMVLPGIDFQGVFSSEGMWLPDFRRFGSDGVRISERWRLLAAGP